MKELLCEYRVFFRLCHDIWATKSERELRSALARKPCRKLLTLTQTNLDRAEKMPCIFFMGMRLRLGICRISIDRGSPKRAPIGRPQKSSYPSKMFWSEQPSWGVLRHFTVKRVAKNHARCNPIWSHCIESNLRSHTHKLWPRPLGCSRPVRTGERAAARGGV